MSILIQNGQVIDPASGLNQRADVEIHKGSILAIGQINADFKPTHTIDATGCVVMPGLVDACARLGEPGHEHEGMLDSELAAAVAGGVTSVVCPPDTQPVLDEPGLVEMLQFRAARLQLSRVFPLGALTRGLDGEALTPMAELTQAGCIGFSQAEHSMTHNQALQRAMQYAATYGYCIWLRAQDAALGKGVAASGPLATRLGLSGVPVAAETIALHTIIDLMRATGARVPLVQRGWCGTGASSQGRRFGHQLRCVHPQLAFHRHRHGLLRHPCKAHAALASTARPRGLERRSGRRHH